MNTAEYPNTATVIQSFASALGTPWAQYRSDLAAAESSWASGTANEFVNYEGTLSHDQWVYAYGVAPASLTQADADRAQSKSDADAALTQATDDATAEDDYQQGKWKGTGPIIEA